MRLRLRTYVGERRSRLGVIYRGVLALNLDHVAAALFEEVCTVLAWLFGSALAVDPISVSQPDDSTARQRRGFWNKQNCGVLLNNRLLLR